MMRSPLSTAAAPAIKCVRLPFADQQVLCMLALAKDITRRPVKDRLEYFGSGNRRKPENWNNPALWGIRGRDGEPLTLAGADPSDTHVMPHRYGGAGDRLIGCEAWRPKMLDADTAAIEYRADGALEIVRDPETWEAIREAWNDGRRGWRPARFMNNWAARLRRENVSVRAERLHAIDEADVLREGVGWDTADREIFTSAVDYFELCWNGIYGETFPWDEDPWVRRIEFKELPT